MQLLLVMGLLVCSAGESNGVSQELTCPYQADHTALPRVWCKQTTSECCDGFTFENDSDHLQTREDTSSFTVSVITLPTGDGVYWCGVLTNRTVLIKLAERYFYSSNAAYAWAIARWVVLPSILALTLLVSYGTVLLTRRRHHVDVSTRVLEEQDEIYVNAQQ